MSSNFWTGLVHLADGLILMTLFGLDTASSQGAGWSSLASASGA